MTICYFGDYDTGYNRTRVLIMGLELQGVKLVHINSRVGGLKMYIELWRQHRALRGNYNLLFVGLGNARYMPFFARLITTKPVVWEPLFSIYDNWVYDRKYVHPHSPTAYKLWLKDWIGMHSAHLVILDVATHAKFIAKTFFVREENVAYALVGADTDIFYPRARTKPHDFFEIEFHGKYIPLHGAEIIMRAAKLLENEKVHFTMIGAGQDEKKTKQLAEELGLKNVTFLPFMPETEVVEYIRNADLCTAMLGDVPRVMRSIPNKMYQAAAMGRVSVNVESSSLREVFTPGVDALAVKPGDAEDLARTIKELMRSGKAEEMGKAAYETFMRTSTPEIIGKNLVATLRKRFPSLPA